MTLQTIGIVGCGLIGGSLALAIKHAYPDSQIHGINRRLDHITSHSNASCFASLNTRIQDLPQDCDLVIVCTPISQTLEHIKHVAAHVNDTCIITDVASTKSSIVQGVAAANITQPFIPAHPMAGKESTGFQSADKTLFKDATYYIVTQDNPAEKTLKTFLNVLQVHCHDIDAESHDALMAAISHVPYLVACSLVTAATQAQSMDQIQTAAGPGFKDCTRVAASSPQWGQDICTYNQRAIINQLERVINTLTETKNAIQSQDTQAITQLLTQAKQSKDQL